jgi:ADP-dependent NAD(P)H-hydrate dehydratase / NAD(P)H-hydrate epimerase
MKKYSFSGFPKYCHSKASTRKIEKAAIDDLDIAELTLMQRAGKAAAKIIKNRYNLKGRNIFIFCGHGNNGGDGYVLANLLHKERFKVIIIQLGDVNKQSDAASEARDFAIDHGAEELTANDDFAISRDDLIIDAMLGIGLTGNVRQEYAENIEKINQTKAKIVSLDIPTGLCADTGKILGSCIKADLTVSFITLKQGMLLGSGREYCGKIEYNNLDLYPELFEEIPGEFEIINLKEITKILPKRKTNCHKGDFGHILVIGGNENMAGAPLLSGLAALRSGAGKVTIATKRQHIAIITSHSPELMAAACEDQATLAQLIDNADVLVIGPGLGQDEWAKMMLTTCLKSDKVKIIDADALNLIATGKFDKITNAVFTPHLKEAARLLNVELSEILSDKTAALNKLLQKYQNVMVLKGNASLVKAADNDATYICTYGNPGMAIAGMGDALTGVIAALIGQNVSAVDAARLAVAIHGRAGDLVAKTIGERGLLVSDLIELLPNVINNKYEYSS